MLGLNVRLALFQKKTKEHVFFHLYYLYVFDNADYL